jgi:hypothetical protein
VLSEAEAFELLTSRRKPAAGPESEAARQIVRELGCDPLALEVAGGYVGKGFETYARYRQSLADASRDAVELGAKLQESLPTSHERSISKTLLKSVRQLGVDGRAFLQLASARRTMNGQEENRI